MNKPDISETEKTPEVISSGGEPVVIQERDHSIRLHDLDTEALKVLHRLRDAGHAGYLVGGGVRDLYLGKQPKDFDISTDARPGQLRKLFRNSRTIGRRFRLVQVFFRGGKIIEVSTLRSQSEYDIDRPDEIEVLPANNTFGSLDEDAHRRDLTINSLFYEIENRTIIDYVGGVRDLDRKIIRFSGDPDRRVTRDPVRMLRAVRHAARTGFCIEPGTWKAIVAHREKLKLCPPSRIRDELLKDLRSGASEPWARIALDSSIFFTLFPWYSEIPFADEDSAHRQLLLSLLGVLDRLQKLPLLDFRVEIPDYMLLALLVLPWADARFDLMQQRLKGPAHYHFSKEIREALDSIFGEHFNLKRMAKDSMTTLLVNLPSFEQFSRHSEWPRWLQKKSYFRDGLRFFSIYREAKGGTEADVQQFIVAAPSAEQDFFPPAADRARENGSTGRKGSRPAFANRKRGVFGLRGK